MMTLDVAIQVAENCENELIYIYTNKGIIDAYKFMTEMCRALDDPSINKRNLSIPFERFIEMRDFLHDVIIWREC